MCSIYKEIHIQAWFGLLNYVQLEITLIVPQGTLISMMNSTSIQSQSCRPGYWSGQPFPSPGALPDPGITPRSPALQVDSLPSSHQGAQEHWSGQPVPSPGDLPHPGIHVGSPALRASSSPAEPPGSPAHGQRVDEQMEACWATCRAASVVRLPRVEGHCGRGQGALLVLSGKPRLAFSPSLLSRPPLCAPLVPLVVSVKSPLEISSVEKLSL